MLYLAFTLGAALLLVTSAQPCLAGPSLIDAAKAGDTAAIEQAVRDGEDVNVRWTQGVTPLMVAAHNGDAAAVEMLLKLGAEVDLQAENGYTALTRAAQQGHAEVVARLLEHGANPTLVDKRGYTALKWAQALGRQDVIRLLQSDAKKSDSDTLNDARVERKSENRAADADALYVAGKAALQSNEVHLGVEQLQQASQLGHLKASYELAVQFSKPGQLQDWDKAAKFCTLAAQGGDIDGLLLLAKFYEEGTGIGKDFAAAGTCYEQAMKHGSLDAQYQLADLLLKVGGQANRTRAVSLLDDAAIKGHPLSQYKLGTTLLQIGARNSDKEAVETALKYIKAAADSGHTEAEAAYGFGRMTIFHDDKGARTYLYRAASKGHSEAQKLMGDIYRNGMGIEPNPTEARAWYGRAAKQGDKEAIAALDEMNKPGEAALSSSSPQGKGATGTPITKVPPGSIFIKEPTQKRIQLAKSFLASHLLVKQQDFYTALEGGRTEQRSSSDSTLYGYLYKACEALKDGTTQAVSKSDLKSARLYVDRAMKIRAGNSETHLIDCLDSLDEALIDLGYK